MSELDDIDWTKVGREMDRGWELLNRKVWSSELQKWVPRNDPKPAEEAK